MADINIVTTEMHTGGHALRIIDKGQLDIKGKTILDKIKYCRQNLDHIRKLLIFEPRGHFDMYGVYLVEPDIPEADIGCIFIHNEGYSTMCGHAVVALGRYVVDNKLVKTVTSPETRVLFQCPCGLVEAFVETDGAKSDGVRFKSVPSFVYKLDYEVAVPELGNVTVDIVFGGAFYAVVADKLIGLDIEKTATSEISRVAFAITESLHKTLTLVHPEHQELAFVYGTIVTDGKDKFSDEETRSMCVFADREVDRSPCGSGVTSRAALQYARGLIQQDQVRSFRGPAGATFKVRVVEAVKYGGYDAVIVEVAGKGNYTGKSEFTLESDDEIGKGFLLK